MLRHNYRDFMKVRNDLKKAIAHSDNPSDGWHLFIGTICEKFPKDTVEIAIECIALMALEKQEFFKDGRIDRNFTALRRFVPICFDWEEEHKQYRFYFSDDICHPSTLNQIAREAEKTAKVWFE